MAIKNDMVKKLHQAEFQFDTPPKSEDIPKEYYPNVITRDGELLIYITDLDESSEGLFEAVGRTVALREYLNQNNLTRKYSVTLVILLEQYKKLKKEIRQILNQRIPLIILE